MSNIPRINLLRDADDPDMFTSTKCLIRIEVEEPCDSAGDLAKPTHVGSCMETRDNDISVEMRVGGEPSSLSVHNDVFNDFDRSEHSLSIGSGSFNHSTPDDRLQLSDPSSSSQGPCKMFMYDRQLTDSDR